MSEVSIRAGRHAIRISHPDKELSADPIITKLQLARHYERVAPAMLPLIREAVATGARGSRRLQRTGPRRRLARMRSPSLTLAAIGAGRNAAARSRLAVVVSACALAAMIAAPSASTASGTPRCATSNLTLSFVRSLGATGHSGWDFALRNVGSATCQLRGYPGAGLLNGQAQLINVTVKRVSFPVRTVVLRTWQRAFFTFYYTTSGPCVPHSFSAYGLQFFPPNATQRLVYYSGRFGLCNPSVGASPGVYPVRASLGGI